MVDETEEFVEWLTDRTNPEYEYNRNKRIVESDLRLNRTRYSDIEAEAKDVLAYQQSDLYKNTERARYLINDLPGEINSEDLKNTMKHYYNISDKEYDGVLHELSNRSDTEVRRGVFDRKVKISSKR